METKFKASEIFASTSETPCLLVQLCCLPILNKASTSLHPPHRSYRFDLCLPSLFPCLAAGGLLDCWFVAALILLASQPERLKALFVAQELNPEGVYLIRIHGFG